MLKSPDQEPWPENVYLFIMTVSKLTSKFVNRSIFVRRILGNLFGLGVAENLTVCITALGHTW